MPESLIWRQFKALLTALTYMVGGLVVFFTLTWVTHGLMASGRPFQASMRLALLISIISWSLSLIIHESGHYLATILNRGYVFQIRVSCFHLDRHRRGYRLSIKRPHSYFGGWVMGYPNPNGDIRRQMIMIFAGGATSNLVFGLIACTAGIISEYLDARGVAATFYTLSVINLFMGVANLVPSWKSQIKDGSKLYNWITCAPDVQAQVAYLRLNGQSWSGKRARDLDEADIAALENGPVGFMRLYAAYARVRQALDIGDLQGASHHIEKVKATYQECPENNRKQLKPFLDYALMESAYIQARFNKDSSSAREQLASAPTSMHEFIKHRVEAAASYAEGSYAQAWVYIARAEAAVDDLADPGTRIEEHALLDDLKIQLEAASA